MKRLSIVALLAIILAPSGCNCCRRTQPAAPVAVCPAPAPVCVDPCAPGAVTYGYGSHYGSGYGVPMQ